MRPARATLIALLVGTMPIATYAANHPTPAKNIIETAVGAGSFKTLAAALEAADLVAPLSGKGPFTVFAPTDAAFAKLPKGTVDELLKPGNREKLQSILKFHVIPGKVGLTAALEAGQAKTLQGEQATIAFSDGKIRINGSATLQTADLDAANGVIHVIDSVLLPPEPKNDILSVAKRAGEFDTFVAAVEASGFKKYLASHPPHTVFVPTDAAFEALPEGTLEMLLKPKNQWKLFDVIAQHAILGRVKAGDALNKGSALAGNNATLRFAINDGIFQVNGVKITRTNIKCDNGIIHVIDAVLLPDEKGHASKGTAPAAARIKSAVEKGVPVFNHGDHGKCADIYAECLQSLITDSSLCASTRQALTGITKKAKEIHCDTTRAWILRRGLDQAYQAASH